jgi:uncharacterized protein YjbI with pentapeptide repeats
MLRDDTRLHSWWQKIQQPRVFIVFGIGVVVGVAFIVIIILGYRFQLDWTGLGPYIYISPYTSTNYQPGKTLWDWLQLAGIVAIPVVVGIGAARFTAKNEEANRKQREIEQRIATDNQYEAALQAYIDKMSDLLRVNNLSESQPENNIRKIARVQTLTVLSRLDGKRKKNVLQFLLDTGLINITNPIVDLKGANLRGADLSFANFSKANLVGADLFGADLKYIHLEEANLSQADLTFADLHFSNLTKVDLRKAYLCFADCTSVILTKADLRGADLSSANFTLAILTDARLESADLGTNDMLFYIARTKRLENILMEIRHTSIGQREDHLETLDSPMRRNNTYKETNFTGADLERANFKETHVTPEQLQPTKSLEGTILPEYIKVTRLSKPNEPGFYLVQRIEKQQ